jgi:hypothetical protein
MDAQRLKSLVTPAGGTLSLNLDDLESAGLSEMFKPFLSGKRLVIEGVTERTESGETVTVVGTGGNQIFKGMKVTAVFSLGGDGQPAVLVTAEGRDGWAFDKSFPLLARSIFSGLAFEPSPKLFLSSADISEQLPAGMTFAGTLKPDSPLGALASLIGGAEQHLTGDVHVVEGAPLIVLFGPVNASVDFGLFKLRDVRYELYSDPNYNAARFEWEADAYLGFSADLVFTAQNKEHTITLQADVYDPRSSILFVTDLNEGLDAAMDELSALLGGIGLNVDVGDLKITDKVKLSDLKVLVNPGGPNFVEYVTLGVETTEYLTLVPDLLELDAIDVSFRIDNPLGPSPRVSGVVSGLVGIGETGTLELSAFFGEFAFGGALRREDPLYVKEVFEHFMKTSNSDLPDLKLSDFNFYVRPSPLSYSAEIELVAGDWAVEVGTTKLSILELKFNMNRPGPEADTSLIARGVFGIGDFQTVVEADYEGVNKGWTFKGGTLEGQAVQIGRFVKDIAKVFNVDEELPAPIAGLLLTHLNVSFNTLTKDFSFTCGASFPIDGKSLEINVLIDLKNRNGVYTKTFGGGLSVGALDFELFFSENNAETVFVAAYVHKGVSGGLKVKELVGHASETAAAYIPASLEIDLKDVLFAIDKRAGATKFLFGLDVGARVSLSDLPLVGRKFPPDASAGVEDLRLLVAYGSFSQTEAVAINNLIGLMKKPLARLPVQPVAATQGEGAAPPPAVPDGFTVSALMNFGGSTLPLSLPVASAAPAATTSAVNTGTTTAPVTTDNAKWFPVQEAFGPVYFDKVGVKYEHAAVWFLLSASLSAAGLTLTLDGLAVGSEVKGFKPEFDLRGVGIEYKGGGEVEVGGALLRTRRERADKKGEFYDAFDGAAFIKAGQLKLSALGSYAELDGHPSLFVYAVLDYPVGGPSFFFVTGLAAGFGYNRLLVVPPVEQVAQFPLVADALSGAAMPAKIDEKVSGLQRYTPPSAGDFFLAVGIKFTSFKLVDSFALLTVSFGTQFEVNLLGLSTLVVPTPVPGETVTPLAEVQLAVRATFNPSKGFLGIAAQLTPNSFLFSRECHLTGGFAFYSWFSGEHKGDFVLTLGGYHPEYKVPPHYPSVPRLGFNWRVSENLTIKGGMYYALTAAALMAGGSLQATWDSGNLKAHFLARADFIIYWKPYHYDAKMYVDIGVSYTYNLFGTHTLNIDVGADLHIWGPEFAGTAHIKLWIISFDVSFGAGSSRKLEPIKWAAFRDSFLPKGKDGNPAVCTVSVADGLLPVSPKADEKEKGKTHASKGDDIAVDWYINPKNFLLVTNSVIPSTAAYRGNIEGGSEKKTAADTGKATTAVGVAPMALTAAEFFSSHTVSFGRWDDLKKGFDDARADFDLKPVLKDVPVALWGQTLTPSLNGPAFVKDALAGFEVRAHPPKAPEVTAYIERKALQYETEKVADAFAWEGFRDFRPKTYGGKNEEEEAKTRAADIVATVNADKPAAARARLLAALGVNDAVELAGYGADGFIIPPQVEAA